MSSVASGVEPQRTRSPFAVPTCAACMGERLHTAEEWKNHPLAGHGFTKESGWSHPDAEVAHNQDIVAELPSSVLMLRPEVILASTAQYMNAKRAASNRTPEAT